MAIIFIVLAALALGALGFFVSLYAPFVVGAVLAGIGGVCALLGWRLLSEAGRSHGSGAIGAGLVGIVFVGGGLPIAIGSAIALLLR